MYIKPILFIIFMNTYIIGCTKSPILNTSNLQGYYGYSIVNHEDNQMQDTLYSTVMIMNSDVVDTLKMVNDILGPVFKCEKELLGLWDVKEDGTGEYFTLCDLKLTSGDTWNLEDEVGFSVGTFERKFKCLNDDTTITIANQKVLKNIMLIEQKDFIDVGGFWRVKIYGFDRQLKLVYLSKSVIDPRKNSTRESEGFIFLNLFEPVEKLSSSEQKEWKSRNTEVAMKWLFDHEEDEDVIDGVELQ